MIGVFTRFSNEERKRWWCWRSFVEMVKSSIACETKERGSWQRVKKWSGSEAFSELCQAFKMEHFKKTVDGFHLLTVFVKRSILYIWQSSEYAFSGYFRHYLLKIKSIIKNQNNSKFLDYFVQPTYFSKHQITLMGSFSHVSMVTKQITYKSFPNFKTKFSHCNLRREEKTRKVTATKIFFRNFLRQEPTKGIEKVNNVVLTHYSPVLLFYTPWKHQKTFR